MFTSINDLSHLSRLGTDDKPLVAGQKNDVEMKGGQLVRDKYSDHVVKVRILASDDSTPEYHLTAS